MLEYSLSMSFFSTALVLKENILVVHVYNPITLAKDAEEPLVLRWWILLNCKFIKGFFRLKVRRGWKPSLSNSFSPELWLKQQRIKRPAHCLLLRCWMGAGPMRTNRPYFRLLITWRCWFCQVSIYRIFSVSEVIWNYSRWTSIEFGEFCSADFFSQ